MQPRGEHGGTSILVLGIVVASAFLVAILSAVGSSYVAHAELQQAADVAAAVVEQSAGDSALDRARALSRANGARSVELRVLDDGSRVRVRVRGRAPAAFGMRRGARLEAVAYAAMPPPTAFGDLGPNPPGQYAGPLELAGGVPVCPVVAAAFRAMDRDARSDGIGLRPTSGFRTFAEQAVLYAALGPTIAAPPGASRHHDATELDIAVGPAGSSTHRWLSTHGPGFGFLQRYSWEPWHWGFVAGC